MDFVDARYGRDTLGKVSLGNLRVGEKRDEDVGFSADSKFSIVDGDIKGFDNALLDHFLDAIMNCDSGEVERCGDGLG